MTCVQIDDLAEDAYNSGAMALENPIPDGKPVPIRLIKTGRTEASEETSSEEWTPLLSPVALKRRFPVSRQAGDTVANARDAIRDILEQRDDRLLVITGPCSIHDEASALEYAARLALLAERVKGRMVLVMRAYVEKPRTSLGWKGMVSDPHLNGSCDLSEGLARARRILLAINEMGVPVAMEMLEPFTPAYLGDLVSWVAVGARTTESQTHREMASGLPVAVGFKNSTRGGLGVAVNAIKSAAVSHTYPGIDPEGRTAVVRTSGNPLGHLVLRGGRRPNYDSDSVQKALDTLTDHGLRPVVVIDCSHGNSGKDHTRQGAVLADVIAQRAAGNRAIVGLMLESHLHAGNQPFLPDPDALTYGVSITDACISWEETERLLLRAAATLEGEHGQSADRGGPSW